MPRCGGSTRSRTSSTGISRASRGTGCERPCRERGGAPAARPRRHVLLDRWGRHQMVRLRRVADRGDPGPRSDARDPRADPRRAPPVELARGARGPGLCGRGAAVRVREQADHRRQYRIPPGDEPAVRSRAGAVAPARARPGGGPGVHGRVGRRPGAAVRWRAATFHDSAGPISRQRARGGERGGVGVHRHGLPLAGASGGERRGSRLDRGRRRVRQPDRVPGVPAGGAPLRGRPCHRLADRDLPRRVSAGARLCIPVARDHAGARPRGLAVSPGRAGAESGVGVARARRDARPAGRDRGRGDPDRDGAQVVARHRGRGRVSDRIIRTYFAITGLFNLAMSLIWGIDTLFKMGAGLDIQQVLLTNAAFTLGSMVFEIPTGVVADTVGRRVSLLLCLVTLFATTLLYVACAWRGWGFAAFLWISVLLGLGYTFYTGAVDAWLVDALKATGYAKPLDPVFARGAAARIRRGPALRAQPFGRPARDAGVARVHELHDLRILQLAALLPRSAGARRRVGGRGDQRAGRVEPHRGQHARRAALARRADAHRSAHGLDGGAGGAGGGLRPAHQLFRGRAAVPAVRGGDRPGASCEAGASECAHSLGAAGDDHLARLDFRERLRRAGADGVGLGRADAIDRHGVGVERGDTNTRYSTLLAGPT